MDLVIMAAGMGSRFGGLKQIEPINDNGEFIIDYSIYDAIRVGFDRVVFIIKKENYDIFRETVGKRVEDKIKVEYVFQEMDNLPAGYVVPEGRVKPWGTGHAILCCKDIVKDNFAIINADDFYGYDAFKVIADFLKNIEPDTYGLVGYKVKNTIPEKGTTKRGVCEVENGYLTTIIESVVEKVGDKIFATPLSGGEQKEIEPNTTVSMNMFGFSPKLFDTLSAKFYEFLDTEAQENPMTSEFLIPVIVNTEIQEKTTAVKVLETTAVWYGITFKEDKPMVVDAIRELAGRNIYPINLWSN